MGPRLVQQPDCPQCSGRKGQAPPEPSRTWPWSIAPVGATHAGTVVRRRPGDSSPCGRDSVVLPRLDLLRSAGWQVAKRIDERHPAADGEMQVGPERTAGCTDPPDDRPRRDPRSNANVNP